MIREDGGYSGTSTASADLMPTLRARAAALTPSVGRNRYSTYDDELAPFRLYEMSIKPTNNPITIIINDGMEIPVPLDTGYSTTDKIIKKLVIVENAEDFVMAFKY